jgi:hypothetical protein
MLYFTPSTTGIGRRGVVWWRVILTLSATGAYSCQQMARRLSVFFSQHDGDDALGD